MRNTSLKPIYWPMSELHIIIMSIQYNIVMS